MTMSKQKSMHNINAFAPYVILLRSPIKPSHFKAYLDYESMMRPLKETEWITGIYKGIPITVITSPNGFNLFEEVSLKALLLIDVIEKKNDDGMNRVWVSEKHQPWIKAIEDALQAFHYDAILTCDEPFIENTSPSYKAVLQESQRYGVQTSTMIMVDNQREATLEAVSQNTVIESICRISLEAMARFVSQMK